MKLISIICLWIGLTVWAIVYGVELWKALMPTLVIGCVLLFVYAYTHLENKKAKKENLLDVKNRFKHLN